MCEIFYTNYQEMQFYSKVHKLENYCFFQKNWPGTLKWITNQYFNLSKPCFLLPLINITVYRFINSNA